MLGTEQGHCPLPCPVSGRFGRSQGRTEAREKRWLMPRWQPWPCSGGWTSLRDGRCRWSRCGTSSSALRSSRCCRAQGEGCWARQGAAPAEQRTELCPAHAAGVAERQQGQRCRNWIILQVCAGGSGMCTAATAAEHSPDPAGATDTAASRERAPGTGSARKGGNNKQFMLKRTREMRVEQKPLLPAGSSGTGTYRELFWSTELSR